jgi:glyoxylase-like metal-dependent hydrolase (beta-lactamase superfamily II)
MLIASRALWLAETNCYVVSENPAGPAVVIDAPPEDHEIADLLAEHDLTPVALLLTHGHVDHMGGAGRFQRRTGAAVYVHPNDDYLTLDPAQQLRSLFGTIPTGDWAPPNTRTDLVDGEVLDLAGLDIEVRHTPGHTPGHCCFYLESAAVLFSGDQLFARSVGRTDLPGGDWEQLLASMKAKVLTLPDEVRVLPGHGPGTTVGEERRLNPFLVGLS